MIRSIALISLLAAAATAAGAGTLTLDECIRQALEQNNQVRLAAQAVRRSEMDVKSAMAGRLPSVNVSVLNYTRSRTGPSVRIQENPTDRIDPETGQRIFREETTQIPAIDRNSFSLSASASQTLYDGGSRRHAHNAARQGLNAAETSFESQRSETVFGVRQRYFALLKAQDLLEVQREALKLSEKQLEGAAMRLEVGAGTRADVLRLKVAVGNAEADLINAEQGVVLARASLNHFMGRGISEPLRAAPVEDAPFPLAGLPLDELLRRAGSSNPGIRQLEYAHLSAEHDLSSAKSAWHPRVSTSLSYGRNNEVFDRVYQEFDQNYRINAGLSVSYNLFDGGLRSAGIQRSRIGLENARLHLEQQRREVALAVETAHLELARLAKILEISEGTLEVAGEDLKLAKESYEVGQGTLLELLDAQVNFTQARSSRVRARHDLAVARANIERLLGGPSD